MSDIAKGILSGGWSLIAGWILPTAINVLIFGFFVLPSLRSLSVAASLAHASTTQRSAAALAAAVVIGLVFSALQAPLYRVLEGYLWWPEELYKRRRERWLKSKDLLCDRLEFIELHEQEGKGSLTDPADKTRLDKHKSDKRLEPYRDQDLARTAVQLALLRERLRRYPVADGQVAATRLGNAIRRLEEYGHDRYRLDSQALWYELTACAPPELSKQVDAARSGVDFFVCLLYGNLLVAVLALVALVFNSADRPVLLITAAVLIAASIVWYRLAVVTTDDWALAVRALVNAGRKPLADAIGLTLPHELTKERAMWSEYGRLVKRPYDMKRRYSLEEFKS